ncbi:hypothetical protein L6452_16249 [Arctium lappa]|uniref:Uncharacterized protein n=1 Tax=Arctium lappa TaxID=4217 RepID=A0ACB9C044_ARCLA|nr:hypothetical protein L6452_16249 [Arctium lappa]
MECIMDVVCSLTELTRRLEILIPQGWVVSEGQVQTCLSSHLTNSLSERKHIKKQRVENFQEKWRVRKKMLSLEPTSSQSANPLGHRLNQTAKITRSHHRLLSLSQVS